MQENEAAGAKAGQEKKGYVGIHATGFKELMLKPELLQAITDCGFEHPSEGRASGEGLRGRGEGGARGQVLSVRSRRVGAAMHN